MWLMKFAAIRKRILNIFVAHHQAVNQQFLLPASYVVAPRLPGRFEYLAFALVDEGEVIGLHHADIHRRAIDLFHDLFGINQNQVVFLEN